MGDDAVAGGEDVGQVGAHLSVDDDRALDAELGAGGGGEVAVGSHADDDEHDVGREVERLVVRAAGVDFEAARSRRRACG